MTELWQVAWRIMKNATRLQIELEGTLDYHINKCQQCRDAITASIIYNNTLCDNGYKIVTHLTSSDKNKHTTNIE